jgi:glycogen synthase
VRAGFERRFSARRMAEEYVRLYRRLAEQRVPATDASPASGLRSASA